ncbi:bifunctional methylenetetrahydrofolate dehydrogenase/methenyltetrahydrofolate cyclohydrolase FolD [Agromyces sp. Marseille-P2726]|uniref:bifunctional methylenetetrahydrofolate dehydrogenase/methenyltetrahydrofolate cyclohydrolase FolD n=1 Tax=Agromyces sp. Marseille-P2726 TaxID=2709132 RepID=UPI00156EEA3A|nr:bifunctional methylenetetrahydrofolate dehydrogenase/methenyltetrahydrofolate cyclohydrolase FolD [Agromyces sp. Marseille-P2726]
MSAKVIDGKAVAARLSEQLADEIRAFTAASGKTPGLATVLVGDDGASEVYVANKRKRASAIGIADHHVHLDGGSSADEIAATISRLADDDAVSGILLQLPLPHGLDAGPLIDLIPANKDVDGLTTLSAGLLARGEPGLRPCTPSGVIELLDAAGIEIAGTRAVVVGRSALVGAPLAQLLTQRNATVTVAHSRTRDLADVTRSADLLVAAAGRPGLITADHVRPGAAVIDVGIHRTPEGLRGDVDEAAVAEVAGWITPVPGGVGPMTIAMLLRNTLLAARLQQGEAI